MLPAEELSKNLKKERVNSLCSKALNCTSAVLLPHLKFYRCLWERKKDQITKQVPEEHYRLTQASHLRLTWLPVFTSNINVKPAVLDCLGASFERLFFVLFFNKQNVTDRMGVALIS